MQALPFDFSLRPDTRAALEELARQRLAAEARQAQALQDRMPNELREARAIDGVGEVQMRVHSTAYHEWAAKFGTYDCWRDKGFRREYRTKIAPETRVKCKGAKISVGWTPAVEQKVEIFGSGEEPRFRKKYSQSPSDGVQGSSIADSRIADSQPSEGGA
jgi:hypothetical protein